MTDSEHNRFDDELIARAGELARDVQPERDLWPAISATIDAPSGPSFSPWQRYMAQAAAVILLVGASSGLTYLAVDRNTTTVTPVVSTGEVPLNARSASFGEQYSLGPGFQDARSDLEGRLEQELGRLSPVARAEVETNMWTIRTAIDEINAALVNEPDNVLLQQLLLSSYQEELELMRKVNGITSAVMLREDF